MQADEHYIHNIAVCGSTVERRTLLHWLVHSTVETPLSLEAQQTPALVKAVRAASRAVLFEAGPLRSTVNLPASRKAVLRCDSAQVKIQLPENGFFPQKVRYVWASTEVDVFENGNAKYNWTKEGIHLRLVVAKQVVDYDPASGCVDMSCLSVVSPVLYSAQCDH